VGVVDALVSTSLPFTLFERSLGSFCRFLNILMLGIVYYSEKGYISALQRYRIPLQAYILLPETFCPMKSDTLNWEC
jgi:hypothetical protein